MPPAASLWDGLEGFEKLSLILAEILHRRWYEGSWRETPLARACVGCASAHRLLQMCPGEMTGALKRTVQTQPAFQIAPAVFGIVPKCSKLFAQGEKCETNQLARQMVFSIGGDGFQDGPTQ